MKKIHKKLALSAETLRTLSEPDLARAIGGEGAVVVGPIVTATRSIIFGGCKQPTTDTIALSYACGGGGGGGGLTGG